MAVRSAGFVAAVMLAAAAAHAGDSSNGVYGGYVGSDAWTKSQMDAARERGILQNNLGGAAPAAAAGTEIALQVTFPPEQRGLGNITQVVLEPEGPGAVTVAGLASNRPANVISTAFAPRKGVVAGHAYKVVLTDARGNKYPVGRIQVNPGNQRQVFEIAAPLIR